MIADRQFKKKKIVIDLGTKSKEMMQSVGGIKSLTARDLHITYSTMPKQPTSSSIQWMNYSEKNIPDPILNEGETGMFWKRMPESTYIYKKAKNCSEST